MFSFLVLFCFSFQIDDALGVLWRALCARRQLSHFDSLSSSFSPLYTSACGGDGDDDHPDADDDVDWMMAIVSLAPPSHPTVCLSRFLLESIHGSTGGNSESERIEKEESQETASNPIAGFSVQLATHALSSSEARSLTRIAGALPDRRTERQTFHKWSKNLPSWNSVCSRDLLLAMISTLTDSSLILNCRLLSVFASSMKEGAKHRRTECISSFF